MSDKDKTIYEQMVDKINNAVGEVAKSAVSPTTEEKPEQVAATADEQVYIPEGTDAAAMPAPLFAAPARTKRKLTKKAPKKTAEKDAKK